MSEASGDTQANDAYTIGAILRGAREASGESIEDVSRILRINWRYLEALEEGNFDELPGSAYAIGFIRTYGDHLGVDSGRLIDQYKLLGDTSRSKTSLEFPEPIPESGLPGGAILFAGLIVAVLAYGGWYLATEEDSFLAQMVSPVPEHLTDETEENAADAVEEQQAVPQPTVVEESQEAPEMTVAETAEQAVEETVAEVEEAVEETAEQVAGTTEAVTETVAEAAGETAEIVTEEIEETVEEVAEAIQQASPETTATVEAAAEEMAADTAEVDGATETAVTGASEQASEQISDVVADETTESTETAEPVAEEVEHIEEHAAADVVDTADSVEEVAEELAADVQEVTETTTGSAEDDAARALNEEQLKALQDSMSGETSGTSGDTAAEASDDGATEEVTEETTSTTSTEAVADEEPDSASREAEETAEEVAAAPAEEPVEETSSGRVFGDEGVARIVVRAKINSWIQVKDDTSGQLLVTRLLKVGDEYHVPDRDGLSLLTGNAGALEILVDGEAVPSIGATGDVRRNVALDADRLKAGDAASQ